MTKLKDPQAFVFLNKRTGDLFEAYKVFFQRDLELGKPLLTVVCISGDFDGWVIVHPKLGMSLFFNRKLEKMMEILGEL